MSLKAYSNALMVVVEDDGVLPMLLAGAGPANENIAARTAAASLLRGRPAAAKTLSTPRRAPVPMRVVGPSRQSIMVLAIASLFRATRRMPTLSIADGFEELPHGAVECLPTKKRLRA